MKKIVSASLSILLAASPVFVKAQVNIEEYAPLKQLVATMTQEDGFTEQELKDIFAKASIQQRTLELMNAQYEAKPWHEYRKIFLNKKRIRNGAIFWNKHEETLMRAQEEYGVPAQVIVAIIGVETYYGENKGSFSVLDSLTTLSSSLPRRSEYFTRELRVFLNTVRNENIAVDSVEGSFAGAIGIPQFMPSSYEAYAVDYNDNGKRDLVNEPEDAIGSVGNYLAEHGWRGGQIAFVEVNGDVPAAISDWVKTSVRGRKGKPEHAISKLKDAGLNFDSQQAAKGSSEGALYAFRLPQDKKRYVIGFDNFYAITRYNQSINYAMAVLELSDEIYALFNQRQ